MDDTRESGVKPSRIPTGTWIRLELRDLRGFVGFTYVDRSAGFSAQGGVVRDGDFQDAPIIVRLPQSDCRWETLTEDEVAALRLEGKPSWVEHYGPQPESGTPWGWWQDHPRLLGRFHPDYPDDLQVLAHDGGPRLTDRRPELVWVRVAGGNDDVFLGYVLNAPQQLTTVSEGSLIQFMVPEGSRYAVMVTDRYLSERPMWTVHPCQQCGLSELFDVPSDLLRAAFPDLPDGAIPMSFTAFCGACGGVQVVEYRNAICGALPATPAPPRRKWWEFWK